MTKTPGVRCTCGAEMNRHADKGDPAACWARSDPPPAGRTGVIVRHTCPRCGNTVSRRADEAP